MLKNISRFIGRTLTKVGNRFKKWGRVNIEKPEPIPQQNFVLLEVIDGFYDVSNNILTEHKKITKIDPFSFINIIPFVVNACFCCECLLQNYLLSNAIESQKTHNIKVLMDKLNKPLRDKIMIQTLNKHYGSTMINISKKQRKRFDSLLEPFKEAYVEYRYAYYSEPTKFHGSETTIMSLNGNIDFLKTLMDELKSLL